MKIKVATAPQQNVPKPRARAQTRENIVKMKATGASVIALTECHHLRTRLVIRNQFKKKGWGVHAPRGSAVIVWDESVWEFVSKWTVTGHGAVRKTSDARNIPVVQLKHKEEGYIVDFYAIHPCPIPTKKAPDMVPAAIKAQTRFFNNLKNDIRVHPRPAVALGDWNSVTNRLGDLLGGRKIKYQRGSRDKIIQVAHVDGKGHKWYSSSRVEEDQPYSDHIILVVERIIT